MATYTLGGYGLNKDMKVWWRMCCAVGLFFFIGPENLFRAYGILNSFKYQDLVNEKYKIYEHRSSMCLLEEKSPNT